jgi:DNA-directed RNA polymerase sigma subunit (sigma70/sigma32)
MKPQEHNSPSPNSETSIIVRELQEDVNFRRSKARKRQWQNPEYREAILAKLHSPEAKERALLSRTKRFQEDHDIVRRRAKTCRERSLSRLKQRLGGDPKEVLEDLHIKQSLSVTDIAKRFGMTNDAIGYWFKKYGITIIRHYENYKVGGVISSSTQELILSAVKNGSFEKLPERQKELLTLRYLQTGKPLTYDQIGSKLGGISRQRVHKLEKATLNSLQGNEK